MFFVYFSKNMPDLNSVRHIFTCVLTVGPILKSICVFVCMKLNCFSERKISNFFQNEEAK